MATLKIFLVSTSRRLTMQLNHSDGHASMQIAQLSFYAQCSLKLFSIIVVTSNCVSLCFLQLHIPFKISNFSYPLFSIRYVHGQVVRYKARFPFDAKTECNVDEKIKSSQFCVHCSVLVRLLTQLMKCMTFCVEYKPGFRLFYCPIINHRTKPF